MKRKTNLFYPSGDDSNFFTFSNYAESLTGTILSTDNKIFPSKFLCFNINKGNIETIKYYLVAYYENKLAVLRDYFIKKDIKYNNFKPLNYLLETFDKLRKEEEIDIELVYIGEITEQDYNGTFNDMICTIDSTNLKRGKILYNDIVFDRKDDTKIVSINNNPQESDYNPADINYLYGWLSNSEIDEDNNIISSYRNKIPESYLNYHPIFDEINEDEKSNKYYIESNVESIDYSEYSIEEEHKYDNIKFDIVIPLYDIVDINYQNNFIEQDENITTINLQEENGDLYNYNIPYGIWFATSKIELQRDKQTQLGPSWSLVLSSQFKPFPYSGYMPNELEISKKPETYYTFAQILARQNKILDEFNRINSSIIDINNRLLTLETKVNTFGTSYTTEILNKNMMVWEKEMLDKYNTLENTVFSYLDNLNWKFRNG